MHLRVLSCSILAFVTCGLCRAQVLPSPRDFFTALVARYDPGHKPRAEDLAAISNVLMKQSAGEARATLPSVMAALAHRDDDIKMDALMALFAIGQRPDGAELLKSVVNDISLHLENTTDPRVPRFAVHVLATIHPVPPPEVVPVTLNFVKKTGQDLELQIAVSEILMERAPHDPAALDAIEKLAGTAASRKSRVAMIDAVGRRRSPDQRLTEIVVHSLKDSDPVVRRRAIYHVSRLGSAVRSKAASELQAIAANPNETPEMKRAAQNALSGRKRAVKPAPNHCGHRAVAGHSSA